MSRFTYIVLSLSALVLIFVLFCLCVFVMVSDLWSRCFVVSGLWSRFNFFGVWDVICIVYVALVVRRVTWNMYF